MSRSARTLLRAAERTSSISRIQPTTVYRSFASSSRYLAEADSAAPLSPKIAPLVDQISTLSLLEVSELVTALKTKLNITEVAMPSSAAPAAGAAPAEAAEEVEKPKEKTIFTVKLEKFDAGAKAKIIREVKALMPNMNLVEAKKFVESVPQTLKENLPKEEAEKLQKTLTDLGATISLS